MGVSPEVDNAARAVVCKPTQSLRVRLATSLGYISNEVGRSPQNLAGCLVDGGRIHHSSRIALLGLFRLPSYSYLN